MAGICRNDAATAGVRFISRATVDDDALGSRRTPPKRRVQQSPQQAFLADHNGNTVDWVAGLTYT